jgi:LPS export ABC transporter protein LptC
MILASMRARSWRFVAAFTLPLCVASFASAAEPADLVADVLEIEGMTFVASAGQENEAIVEAEHASFLRTDRVARLIRVHARVGKAAGAETSTAGGFELECERGHFDVASGDLTAEGNVRGVTEDGRRFETQQLVYRRATGRVSTRSPVVIRDAFGTARGAGFEYWIRENRFRLIGGASVEQGS